MDASFKFKGACYPLILTLSKIEFVQINWNLVVITNIGLFIASPPLLILPIVNHIKWDNSDGYV